MPVPTTFHPDYCYHSYTALKSGNALYLYVGSLLKNILINLKAINIIYHVMSVMDWNTC